MGGKNYKTTFRIWRKQLDEDSFAGVRKTDDPKILEIGTSRLSSVVDSGLKLVEEVERLEKLLGESGEEIEMLEAELYPTEPRPNWERK